MYPYDFRPKRSGINHNEIFVAMPFNAKFDGIFSNMIVPATEKANAQLNRTGNQVLKAYRTKDDMRTRSGWINILEHLLTAQIVMGVLTSDNPNVFYELGIAHAKEPISRQILLAGKGYKPKFNTKDLIYYEYDEADLDTSGQQLAVNIADAIKSYDIERETAIHQARAHLGPYEFDVLMAHGSARNFALHTSPQGVGDYEKIFGQGTFEKRIQGMTYLCHQSLLALIPKPRLKDTGLNVEFSYYWTGLGNDVLFVLKLIDIEELERRKGSLPDQLNY